MDEIFRQRFASVIEMIARERFGIPILLILVVAGVYLPVVDFEFLNYDDPVNIQSNPLVNDFSGANLVRFWSHPYKGLYVPLTYTIWGWLATLTEVSGSAGLSPLPFHLANLFLHLASTLVIFSLLRRFFDPWGAAAGALIFAVHPVQVEAVAWATGMKDLLAGFLTCAVLWAYLRYVEGASRLSPGRYRYYVLATLGMAAAVLAKPSVVVVPVLTGIMACLLLRRPFGRVARELVPWLLIVLPVALVTKQAQPDLSLPFSPSFGQRFLVAGDALSFYLGKLLWPLELGFDYGRTPEYVLAHDWVYCTGLLPYLAGAGLLYLAWKRGQSWPVALVGVVVVTLLPVLGFVSFYFQAISTVADRYLYTAMLGPALAVAWLVGRYRTSAVRLGVAGLLLFLAGLSVNQLASWRNSQTLAVHALQLNPDSIPANHNLALVYTEQGRYDLALASYRKVLKLAPEYDLIHFSLGELFLKLQLREEALASFLKVVEITPDSGAAYDRLGLLYNELGRPGESLAAFQKAVAVGNPEAVTHLADLQKQLAGAMVALERTIAGEPMNSAARWQLAELLNLTGRQREALAVYRELAVARPEKLESQYVLAKFFSELQLYDEAKAVYLLGGGENDEAMADNEVGLICLELGRPLEAVAFYQKAVAIRPDLAETHANLGVAFRQLGRTNEAIAAFRQALALDPGLTGVYLDLGHLLASLGQDGEAVELYRQAGVVNSASAIPAFALGRHWLERGRFAEAQVELEKSLHSDPDFAPALASLAQLYRQTGRTELAADYDKRTMRSKYGGGA
jgi:tetratricopeptide (TPR) repeat protein